MGSIPIIGANNLKYLMMSNQEIKDINEISEELKNGLCSINQAVIDLQHLSLNIYNWSEDQYNDAYFILFPISYDKV